MIKMTLNKREIDVVVDTMLYLDAVTADVGQVEVEADEWEETESDDGHRELYEEDWRDGQPDEAQEWHDFDPDC
tara:strand:- start:48 stop:269 length:222 start_codon:yes stop_codon:yes gene_type:complete